MGILTHSLECLTMTIDDIWKLVDGLFNGSITVITLRRHSTHFRYNARSTSLALSYHSQLNWQIYFESHVYAEFETQTHHVTSYELNRMFGLWMCHRTKQINYISSTKFVIWGKLWTWGSLALSVSFTERESRRRFRSEEKFLFHFRCPKLPSNRLVPIWQSSRTRSRDMTDTWYLPNWIDSNEFEFREKTNGKSDLKRDVKFTRSHWI